MTGRTEWRPAVRLGIAAFVEPGQLRSAIFVEKDVVVSEAGRIGIKIDVVIVREKRMPWLLQAATIARKSSMLPPGG